MLAPPPPLPTQRRLFIKHLVVWYYSRGLFTDLLIFDRFFRKNWVIAVIVWYYSRGLFTDLLIFDRFFRKNWVIAFLS